MSPISKQRAKIVPLATGQVVEIGIGSGHNLPHYNPVKVEKIIGVDPDDHIWKRSEQRRADCPIPIERMGLSGESIPLDDNVADTVLVTYSLCTIPDPVQALREMKRLVKPDGQILFLEHGLSPEANVAKWQKRIDPVWKSLAGGCHTSRNIPEIIRAAGLSIQKLEQMYVPGPKALGYNYWGQASA